MPTQQALPLPSAVTKPKIETVTVSHTQAEADVVTTRTHSHSASDETITAGVWHVNIGVMFLIIGYSQYIFASQSNTDWPFITQSIMRRQLNSLTCPMISYDHKQ